MKTARHMGGGFPRRHGGRAEEEREERRHGGRAEEEREEEREERARGGGAGQRGLFYNAQGSEVEKEAKEKGGGEDEGEERKRGGRIPRRRGGSAEMHGEHERGRMRLDRAGHRPGRQRGGGVGSDQRPLSTASRNKDAEGHSTGESGAAGERGGGVTSEPD